MFAPMKMMLNVSALAAALFLLAACNEKSTPAQAPSKRESAVAPTSTNAARYQFIQPIPTNAQPTLQTIKLWLGTNELNTELALTPAQIQAGMMWRTNMGEMEGMLFVFAAPHQVSFWMKNTLLPLSCAYIDPEGTILEIYDMNPRDESPIPSLSSRIQYVLEVNQGWFQRHNVSTGAVVTTEHGPLSRTFRPKR